MNLSNEHIFNEPNRANENEKVNNLDDNKKEDKPNFNDIKLRFKRLVCPIHLDVMRNFQINFVPKENSDPDIIWYDGIFKIEKYDNMPTKRMNKIPGLNKVCCKSSLFNSLNEIKKVFKKEYDFVPLTLIIPKDLAKLESLDKTSGIKTWIYKPDIGYGGKGIKLYQDLVSLSHNINIDIKPSVVQEYKTSKLKNGYKLDFRIYLLITCLDPLQVYFYKEGIARFCSEKYKEPSPENLKDEFSHITNIVVNCKNPNAHSYANDAIYKNELEDPNRSQFEFVRRASSILKKAEMDKIKKLSQKTILALYPEILKTIDEACEQNANEDQPEITKYQRFFHLLGLDVIIDQNGNPYILELNDNPGIRSFNDIDKKLKTEVIESEIKLIHEIFFKENQAPEMFNFERILPSDDKEIEKIHSHIKSKIKSSATLQPANSQ